MKLCETYKYPTLATRIYLHMRKNKIEISAITYSYYNIAVVDPTNWPDFDKDRWAKLRLTWLVVSKFKENLRIKKQREDLLKKKKRRSNISSRNSNSKTLKHQQQQRKEKTLKKNDTLKRIQITNSIHNKEIINHIFDVDQKPKILKNLHEEESVKNVPQSVDKLSKEEVKNILLSKYQSIDFNLDEFRDKCDIHFNSSGIISNSIKNSEDEESKKPKNLLSIKNLNKSLGSLNSSTSFFRPTFLDEIKQKNPVDNHKIETSKISDQTAVNEDVKRRLFDQNSDFIYEPNKVKKSNDIDLHPSSSLSSHGEEFDDEEDEENSDDFYDEYDSDELSDEFNSAQSEEENFEEDDDSDPENVQVDEHYFSKKNMNKNNNNSNNNLSNGSVRKNYSNSHLSGHDSHSLGSDKNDHRPQLQASKTIDIENITVSSGINNNRKTVEGTPKPSQSSSSFMNFQSPFSSPFSKILANKKVSSFIQSSGTKLKNMTDILTEKSLDIKDSFILNTNQQELTSKLKSMSNYTISTPKILNALTKSNSNTSNLNNESKYENNNNNNRSKSKQHAMNTDVFEINLARDSKIDLEEIPTSNDDTFQSIPFEWWNYHKNLINSQICVEVQISSCNYCDNCKSFLYDEEIMSAWTLKESVLNIKCIYCSVSLVPKLYIKILDYEALRKRIVSEENYSEQQQQQQDFHPLSQDEKSSGTSSMNKAINSTEFTVEYLSPFVVRKELENIFINKNSDDSEIQFLKNHPIVFWNLVWYYKRIGVDNSHLMTSLLNHRIDNLLSTENLVLSKKSDEYSFYFKLTPNNDKLQQANLNKPFTQHNNVLIKCMWDNLKLQNEKVAHDLPLYLCVLIQRGSNVLNGRMISVHSQEELKEIRPIIINPKTLARLCDTIIGSIKKNQVEQPFKAILSDRVRLKMNLPSVYREISFLILTLLERELIEIGN